MQVSRSLGSVGVSFDDERLVANAGLIAPASLAEHLGLKAILEERIDLGDAPGRANVGHKAMTVIHAVLAGADSINDTDVLRAGATAAILGHAVAAPSTIGTVLRSFSWAHVRQIDSASAEMYARMWSADAGPDDLAAPFTIDMDSSIHESYGTKKQGATRFTYTHVRGYHPLYAMAAPRGEVLHSRLRGGNSHTARGAPGFLVETFSRVRAGGVTGPLSLRADSGFYARNVVDAEGRRRLLDHRQTLQGAPRRDLEDRRAGMDCDPLLARRRRRCRSDPLDRLRRGQEEQRCRLPAGDAPGMATSGSQQLALLATYSYHAFITDKDGGAVELDAWHRAHAVVENAIKDLKYGVGLNHLPSGRFGANAA